MTPAEVLTLRSGELVEIEWPGTADGTDRKRAMVEGLARDGEKIVARVARVDRKGRYTGAYGSLRSFPAAEVLERIDPVHAATGEGRR